MTPKPRHAHWLVRILILTGAYFILGRLALMLAIPPGFAAPVWPAAGISLAALLLWGGRYWPGVALGSALLNLTIALETNPAGSLWQSLQVPIMISIGATLQAGAGAWLIRRAIGFPNNLTRESDILKFLALGGPVSCLINSAWSTIGLWLLGRIALPQLFSNWWTWWVGDTIGAILVTPLLFSWAFARDSVWERRKFSVALPLGITCVLVVFLFLITRNWEQERMKLDFERRTDLLAQFMESDSTKYMEVLRLAERFLTSADQSDRAAFRHFLEGVFERFPGIQAFSWNPWVRQSERSAFETQMRGEGLVNFQILEMENGRLIPAAPRNEYAPVVFIERRDRDQSATGFDRLSDPLRREAYLRAMETGQPAATERLHIMQGIEPGAGYGIILFMPVYSREVREIKPEERRANFRGCVAVLVNLKEVVEGSIRTLDREGLGLKIIDLMAQPSKRLLLQLEPNLAPPENPYSRSEQHGIALQRELPFQIGGRDWNVQFSLDTAYFLKHRPWQAWGVLAGGLLFTGFLGAFLLVVTGRSAAVEELVNQRTGELQLLNRTLAFQMAEREQAETLLIEKTLAMENAFEGIARLDSEGRFTSINRAYANMTGYEAGELIGESWSLVFHADDLARIRRTFEGTQVKKRVDVEARGLRKDGSEFFAEIVRIPAYGADHAFLGHYLFIRDVTARKQAEAELRSSEERFAKVFRSSPVAIAISTVEDGCLIDLNEAYRKMFGYERAEMVGRNAAELIWVDPKRRGDFVRLLRAHHFVHNFEAQFRTKSGEVREGMGSAELIQLDGKPRILSLIHDVTDRKRAEEKLRQSEMQLATAQQIAHLGSWEWQVELNQVTWSDELYRLFGLRPQECQVQYETFLALVHPDDRAFVGKVVSDALKNHEPFEYVFRGLHREKGEVILHATGQVITDADGRAVRMFGTAQDITKQREAEAALRLSEEQFRSAFDHAAIGMALVSLEGRWLRVNASLCRILGYTEQELLAKNFPEMTHPEDLAENMESARRLVAGEISSYQTEKRYFHKQGHIVWVLLSASIVRNFNQAPLHFVSQVEDITARKRAEQELMASLREKEVLLKEVHHRVKNNLQIITSMLNLQAGKVRDTDSLALLKEIQARIRSIALIHETLYRSQDMAHIDFPNYVQTLGANLVRSFASRSQLIRLNIEVDPVQLNVDLAMPCGLIINELVANALKYAFPDKVAGEICIRFQRRSEGEYLLRVTDTGRGFPAGVDFRHTDSLGLQLVCALTAQLGGTITMRSTPGTEFSIIFHE